MINIDSIQLTYIFYFFAFLFIVSVGLWFLFGFIINRREERRDRERDKRVDKLLEVDLQDWYQNEYAK